MERIQTDLQRNDGVFELGPALYDSIHRLRETREGIQYLERTGQFQRYMRERLTKGTIQRPFIAWDGEGWSDTDSTHRYMLFMCSEGDHIEYPLLSTRACLELILDVGARNKQRRPIHVIYGGGYDVTHILREMPEHLREMLLATGNCEWYIREAGQEQHYSLEYRPHKWFTVRGMHWPTGKYVTVKIYDVMTFFQSSFIKALESRGIAVQETIVKGKANRSEFTFADMDEIKVYCQQELESLVMLCDRLRDEFNEAGLAVSQYYGPGAVANVTMKHYGIRKHMKRPEREIEIAAAGAYFGGRFETMKVGHHEGTIYQADINSAYPNAIRALPDLASATWEPVQGFDGQPGLYYCTYDGLGNYPIPHPLPWRGKGGTIGFPCQIDAGVWLWHFEAKYATNVRFGYTLHCDWTISPFAFVEGMYRKRQEWKRQGKGGEKALKLALNSLYGKMAQRVGGKAENGGVPSWHQLEWAGMVTSATRAMIWEAICQNPSSVISVETDSVTTTEKLDLNYGSGLGQWELTEFDWITYIQSGIYWSSGDAGGKSKTRGIDVSELSHDMVMDYLAGDRLEPLLVKTRNFIGLTNSQASWNYGQWNDSIKEITISDGKRTHVPGFCDACKAGKSMAETMHTLIATPHYGITASEPHELPWLNMPVTHHDEMVPVGTEAIEDWQ